MKQAAAVALSAVIGLTAVPAIAEPQDANKPVVVVDATGEVIGRLIAGQPAAFPGTAVIARQYARPGGELLVSISFSRNELDNNFVFFYASNNCTGQAYIQTGYYISVPDAALFEQETLTLWWGDPSNQVVINTGSATYGDGACDPTVKATGLIVSPSMVLDATSRGFKPPFRAE